MTEQLPLFGAEVLGTEPSDAKAPGFIAELGPAGREAAGALQEHALTESGGLGRSADEFSLELFP